jgi:DNA-binding NarL/FixJ family response regulator
VGQAVEMTAAIHIAWIDSHRLIRECLSGSLAATHPSLTLVGYESIQDCITRSDAKRVDLVVYHVHDLRRGLGEEVSALQLAIQSRPIILMADAEDADEIKMIRDALRCGANGYVCTRTSTISMAVASSEEAAESFVREPLASDRLTDRQLTVLAQVKQGKANKAIARDLGMSESAVKVHIRSIMRKMGAANRTQAAFASRDRLGVAGTASLVVRDPQREGDDRDV